LLKYIPLFLGELVELVATPFQKEPGRDVPGGSLTLISQVDMEILIRDVLWVLDTITDVQQFVDIIVQSDKSCFMSQLMYRRRLIVRSEERRVGKGCQIG